MKQGIHPTFYEKAKVTCACGTVHYVGSTVPEMRVEICSACHPFYTGEKKFIDIAGRVDRFKAKVETAKRMQAAKIKKQS